MHSIKSRIRLDTRTDDPDVCAALRDYWEQRDEIAFVHKVGPIAARFGIRDRDLAPYLAGHGVAHVPTWPCSTCGGIRILRSRADYLRGRQGASGWSCDACEEQGAGADSAAFATAIRAAVSGTVPSAWPPARHADRVLLLALSACAGHGQSDAAGPVREAHPPLSPTRWRDRRIVDRLADGGHIAVDPASDPEAFEWDEFGRPEWFDPELVRWRTGRAPHPFSEAEIARHSVFADLTDGGRAALVALGRDVLIQECFQFLELMVARNGFQFHPGMGTRALFESLIEDHSVAQVYNIVWRSARSVADYVEREPIHPQHAGALLVRQMTDSARYMRAEGAVVKPYRRDRGAPRSRLAEVLFDSLLGIGPDVSFHTPWQDLAGVVGDRLGDSLMGPQHSLSGTPP